MPAFDARKLWPLAVTLTVGGLLATSACAQTPAPTASTMQVNDIPPGQIRLTPAQMPPKQPEVTFQNGELVIVADNSTLSAILHSVEKTAGIKLQGNAPEDRLFGKFGPGSPRDVLTQLFSGAHIDYILQGNENPNSVASITINNRGALNADMLTRLPAQQARAQGQQNPNGMNGQSIEAIRANAMRHRAPLNSELPGGQEPENTNGYTPATDQSGTEENGYQPGQVPPPPTQQQLLQQLQQMQPQMQQSQRQPDPQ